MTIWGLKWGLFWCFFEAAGSDLVRDIQLSRKMIDASSLDLQGVEFTYGNQIQCVKACLEVYEDCFSVMYWKNERKCTVHLSAYVDVQIVQESMVSWFVLRDPTSYTYYEEIGRWLVYRHGSKTWKQAEAECDSETPRARLYQVDSQKKQNVGQKVAKNSGKLFVHIGVYHELVIFPPSSTWRYIDGTEVDYTNWANILEPKFPTWAALEMLSGYKWAAVEGILSTGAWICERL